MMTTTYSNGDYLLFAKYVAKRWSYRSLGS